MGWSCSLRSSSSSSSGGGLGEIPQDERLGHWGQCKRGGANEGYGRIGGGGQGITQRGKVRSKQPCPPT